MKGLLIAICVFLGLALLPMPYGYYMFLRLAVCAYAIFVFTQEQKKGVCFGSVSAAAIALLYNPVFRVHLEKEVWMWVNIITILLFIIVSLPWREFAETRRERTRKLKEEAEKRNEEKFYGVYYKYFKSNLLLPNYCVRCKETIDISTSKDLLCPSCYQKVHEFIEQEENEFTKTGNLPMKLNFKCKHCGAKERTRSFTFGFCKPCYWSLCELESIAKKDLKGYERYKKNMLAIKKARTNKEKIYWRPA